MKESDKNKPIKTIPKNVWESTHNTQERKNVHLSETTDLQGNGYPADLTFKKEKDH